ncbi:MAG: FISUMP domain-containing protein [Lutibacter sp.]|nr:FISUMP domain-containing protein [Lutibacter sp.]
MKTLIIFFVSILFVTPCFSQKDLLPVYPNEINYQNNRAYFNGSPFTGLLVEKKTNKKIGEFRNGYKNGMFTEYFSNSKKKSEGNFVNGVKEGSHSEWHENNNKMKECNYEGGILNRAYSEWYSNGQLKLEYSYYLGKIIDGNFPIYFENGVKEKDEYFLNGIKVAEGITIKGMKEGIWTEWFKTGEKKKVVKYEKGNSISSIYENTYLVSDVDDNIYHTIMIGSQVWMMENLKTTKFRNGELIPNITSANGWANTSFSAYSNYDNNERFVSTYGRLYNGYTINDHRNICPEGWHIPTVEEWSTLESYLGGFNSAGGKLKEIGTNHWKSPNSGASSSTNFLALPGGARNYTGEFGYLSQICYWWSMTNNINGPVWSVNYNSANFYKDTAPNKFGFSVRCIKD